MHKALKSALALLAVSALPFIAVAPASAAIPRNAFTFDCNLGNNGEDDHALAPGESVTITLLNCADPAWEISDSSGTGNATLGATEITATPLAITTDPAKRGQLAAEARKLRHPNRNSILKEYIR
jgi:hypothetical protein